ncbi:MAG: DUF3014 domain-containing protein [Pseudomonadota bacterium]|nr:DUF3014 domain-containing protein [Pseudomonadota bacterium]MEC8634100.1 DUF3014 domain-containing protein [Pseudomonadota bacterium]
MTDKKADDKANPTILAILFAGILATLVFILITGDYGESEVPEQTTEITFVEVEMVPAPEPELIEEEVVIFEEERLPESPPKPTVTEETADTYARETIEIVNGGKALAQFVAGDYIVERAVAIVDALRRGEVPYKLLPVGRPSKSFPVSDDGLRVTMDPSGFSRYDGFAQWVNGIDMIATVKLLDDYEQIATEALSRMGVGDFDIRSAVLAATTEILATPIAPQSTELMKRESNWVYMDPELEALSSLQKQVLRMGPENSEIIQKKARELRGAVLESGMRS